MEENSDSESERENRKINNCQKIWDSSFHTGNKPGTAQLGAMIRSQYLWESGLLQFGNICSSEKNHFAQKFNI